LALCLFFQLSKLLLLHNLTMLSLFRNYDLLANAESSCHLGKPSIHYYTITNCKVTHYDILTSPLLLLSLLNQMFSSQLVLKKPSMFTVPLCDRLCLMHIQNIRYNWFLYILFPSIFLKLMGKHYFLSLLSISNFKKLNLKTQDIFNKLESP
jgi:hypothetical protein